MNLYKLSVLTFSLIAGIAISAVGQTATVLTTGLNAPNKIIKCPENSLLIAEAGTTAPNTGRISVADRTTGMRHTLVAGLPSALNFLGGNPNGDPSGPSGLLLRGNTLFVTTGSGNAVMPGGGPGLELPNPMPASPLFNTIFEITLPGGFASLDSSFTVTPAHQIALDNGETVTISNLDGQEIVIRVVANLPDYRPQPVPDHPNNVKASNLYGVEIWQKRLFVNDAGQNEIKAVTRYGGDVEVFTVFPPRPNPMFPGTGGPFIEAVPDNIHRFGNRLLVPLLTGFPFIVGGSEIQIVNLKGGEAEVLIDDLTSAIDIAKAGDEEEELAEGRESGDSFAGPVANVKGDLSSDVELASSKVEPVGKSDGEVVFRYSGAPLVLPPGEKNAYYTLEFSTNMLANAPGRLRYYQSPIATPVNVLTNLITPTSMTRDGDNGNIFITNIGPGTVTKVTFP